MIRAKHEAASAAGEDGGVAGWTPEFSARLKKVIAECGGVTAVGKLVGVKYSQVSAWRDGASRMPFYAAARMCRTTGRSLDWLYDGGAATAARDGGPRLSRTVVSIVLEALLGKNSREEVLAHPEVAAESFVRAYERVAGAMDEEGVLKF